MTIVLLICKFNMSILSAILVFQFALVIDGAFQIDVNKICYDEVPGKIVPHCQIEVDLMERQKCVQNQGIFMILDSQAQESAIVCRAPYPLDVTILLENDNFLSYEEGEKYIVIHERESNYLLPGQGYGNESTEVHVIRIPLLVPNSDTLQFKDLEIRKFTISKARDWSNSSEKYLSFLSDGMLSQGYGSPDAEPTIELLFMRWGSGAIFGIGPQRDPVTSDITYIRCLYDWTSGIKEHYLETTSPLGETVRLSTHTDTYDPLRGFMLNVTEVSDVYTNYSYTCAGESPAVDPNLLGAAVVIGGFGVEFHGGLWIKPDTKIIECYTPPCKVYCESEEPITLRISTSSEDDDPPNVHGKLLFRSFEKVSRYGAMYSSDLRNGSTSVHCMRGKEVLHSWQIMSADIIDPNPDQTLQLFMDGNKKLQCTTINGETVGISSFMILPCNNHIECSYYKRCINEEKSVQQWQGGYAVEKLCSAKLNLSGPCQNSKNCKKIEYDVDAMESGIINCGAENGVVFQSTYFFGFDKKLYFHPLSQDIPPAAVITILMNNVGSLTADGFYKFTCQSHYFYTEHGLQWKLKWKNGSTSTPLLSDDSIVEDKESSSTNPKRESRIWLEIAKISSVICSAPLIHSNARIELSLSLVELQERIPPLPTLTVPSKIVYLEVDSPQSVECSADENPAPSFVTWVIPSKISESTTPSDLKVTIEHEGQKAILTFNRFTEALAGDYFCVASNGAHNVTRTISIAVYTKSKTAVIVGATVGSAMVLILLVLAFAF